MKIDFHTHILPGLDDGSAGISQSLDMLRAEGSTGVDRVVFTPHYYAFQYTPEEFLRRRQRAWQQLLPHMCRNLPLVSFGAEVFYFDGISQAEQIPRLRILGTPYLLLEMPTRTWDSRVVEEVLALNAREDIQVVLAHIERYDSFSREAQRMRLLEEGVLFQSNLSFFASRRTRKRAMNLLKKGQIHLLGSDCHNMSTRRPDWDTLPQEVMAQLESSAVYQKVVSDFHIEML